MNLGNLIPIRNILREISLIARFQPSHDIPPWSIILVSEI